MYKTMKLVAMASVFALVLVGTLAYADESTGFYNMYEPGRPFDSAWGTAYAQESSASTAVQPAEETNTGNYYNMYAPGRPFDSTWGTAYGSERPRYMARSEEASSLIGYPLYGIGNMDLGYISDYIVDQTHGRVALIILSDVPGFGTGKVAIPYSMLRRTAGGYFTIIFPPNAPISPFEDSWSSDSVTAYRAALAPGEVHGVIDPSFVASVYDGFGIAPYWAADEMGPNAGCLFSYNQFLKDKVAFAQSGMGKVDDFVYFLPDGHVSLLVLRDVPGRGDALVTVPFSFLARNPDNTYALNISSEDLASAPSFNGDADATSLAYVNSVYRHYGVQPFWTDDSMMGR